MKFFNNFFNLFHRKYRFTSQYSTISFLKKFMFYGLTGFIVSLAASKFIYSNLLFSFEPSQKNRLLIKLNPALQRGTYNASMHMIFGIFQRLYVQFREEQPYIRMQEEQLEGEQLNWVALHDKTSSYSQKKYKQIPLVLVVAGSEGLDNTCRHLLLTCYNLGYRVVAYNPRDLYDLQRMDKIVKHIKSKYPSSEVLGVGVEYGANLLINFAAKNSTAFEGLVSVGNPFDLVKSQIKLQDSWLWRPLYSSMLKGKVSKAQQLNKNIKNVKDLSLFELEKYTYDIEDDKYAEWKAKNSCINWIKDLQTTTLFLQSKEDPFTQQIEGDQRFYNQKCIYVTTQRGGHNEWLENIWMNRWFIAPIRTFLKLVHDKKVQQIEASSSQAKLETA